MEKINLTQQFGERLREAMIGAGFNSPRSTSGVCIHKLAEITGYSLQICRKYLRGEALPEPIKIMEIANTLQVSPCWLLFGGVQEDAISAKNKISINKDLLYYILTQATSLYKSNYNSQDIPNFLIELINDISLINANNEQSRKIVDLALTSIKHFSNSPPSD